MWASVGFARVPTVPATVSQVCILFALTALAGFCLLGASVALWLKRDRLAKVCFIGVGLVFGVAVLCAL